MSMATTMDAIAAAGAGLINYRYAYPASAISVPALIVGYPEIEYDTTFGAGSLTAVYPVWVVVGKTTEPATRDALSAFLEDGAGTLKAAIESALAARVTNASIDELAVGDVNYVAARMEAEVIE